MFIILGLLLYGAWRLYENEVPGVMTPERKAIYMTAMQHERDPRKLEYWAKWFDDQGFPSQAKNLRKRIAVPTMNGEERARRQTIVRRAFASENPYAIREVADQFLNGGYGATYQELQDYADGLEVDQSLPTAWGLNEDFGNDYGIGTMQHQRWGPHFGQCSTIPYGITPPLPPNCPPYGYPPPIHDMPPEPADMVPRFGDDGQVTFYMQGNDYVLSPDSEAGYATDTAVQTHVQKMAQTRADNTGKSVSVWSNDLANILFAVKV